MSWKFETRAEATKTDLTTTSKLGFDGTYIWASGTTNTYVFKYWDATLDTEGISEDNYYNDNLITLSTYQTIAIGTVVSMTYLNGSMYLMTNSTTIKVYSTSTYTLTTTLTIPEACQLKISSSSGRIWCISTGVDTNDQQKLYYYNTGTSTWSSAIPILGKKQTTIRDICNGNTGYIYITSRNDHAIVKVDASTGTSIALYTVSRHPTLLYTDPATNLIYISCADDAVDTKNYETGSQMGSGINEEYELRFASVGIISKFDQTTNTATNFSAAGSGIHCLGFDNRTNTVWQLYNFQNYSYFDSVNPSNTKPDYGVLQINKTTGLCKFTHGRRENYAIDTVYPVTGLYIPTFTSGAKTIYARLVMLNTQGTSTYITVARLNSLIRENYVSIRGTAMVGIGAQGYIGD